VEGRKRIIIFAKRDIKKGEEIAYDYMFPIEEDKVPCSCGAWNCRGTMN
jgi:histone-lysine N-methyltransferase SETD1